MYRQMWRSAVIYNSLAVMKHLHWRLKKKSRISMPESLTHFNSSDAICLRHILETPGKI